MISLRKHLGEWDETPIGDAGVGAYYSFLLTVGKVSHRAVPELENCLEQKLSRLAESLSQQVDPEVLQRTNKAAVTELSQWAERAFEKHEAGERDLKAIIDTMAQAVVSVTERDQRYTTEVGNLATQLRTIAGGNDLAAIRRSIIEGVNQFTACMERIAEDGRRSITRLSAEVEDYRSRLDRSEKLSSTDTVTGLPNRRVFEEQLNAKIKAGHRFCLILIDLNRFKEINDRYGHLVGDDVLKYLAGKLKLQFPSADLVARWGGDEFAVIISSGKRDVDARITRIRRSTLGEYEVMSGKQKVSVPVGASFGVVDWNGTESSRELLGRADAAMYEVKDLIRSAGAGA